MSGRSLLHARRFAHRVPSFRSGNQRRRVLEHGCQRERPAPYRHIWLRSYGLSQWQEAQLRLVRMDNQLDPLSLPPSSRVAKLSQVTPYEFDVAVKQDWSPDGNTSSSLSMGTNLSRAIGQIRNHSPGRNASAPTHTLPRQDSAHSLVLTLRMGVGSSSGSRIMAFSGFLKCIPMVPTLLRLCRSRASSPQH